MRKILLVFAMIAASLVLAQPASANNEGQVCDGLSSEKINTPSNPKTLTISAPSGFLIDYYCVKAGSANQEDGGPVIVQVDPPKKTVTISHPSGKEISHYSAHYVRATVPDDKDEPNGGGNGNGNGGQQPAHQDKVLPATGGLPVWVLVLAGPLAAAGVIVLRRRESS